MAGDNREDDHRGGDHRETAGTDEERQPAGRPRPAERLRARAVATDRAARFELRLAEVQRVRERRRRLRRLVRIAWVLGFAGVGVLVPIVGAAVLGADDPSGRVLLAAAVTGAVLGAVGPGVRDWLARRRGATAWDAYNERYVLLGDPSAEVRDADGPERRGSGPPPPPLG